MSYSVLIDNSAGKPKTRGFQHSDKGIRFLRSLFLNLWFWSTKTFTENTEGFAVEVGRSFCISVIKTSAYWLLSKDAYNPFGGISDESIQDIMFKEWESTFHAIRNRKAQFLFCLTRPIDAIAINFVKNGFIHRLKLKAQQHVVLPISTIFGSNSTLSDEIGRELT